MKKVKFSTDNGNDFFSEFKQEVNDYFLSNKLDRRGGVKMKARIFLYCGLVISSYFLMLISTSVVLFLMFYVLMGLMVLLVGFNISHDAAHNVAVKGRFWNNILFQISFNLQGNNAYVWGRNHNESHHLYTNIEGSDIDVVNNPLVRTSEKQKLKKHHRFQHIYVPLFYLFYSLNWFFMREGLMLLGYSSRTISVTIPKLEVVKLIVFKLLYLVMMLLLPIYVLPIDWYYVLIGFVLNHFIISLIFTAVLGVSHLSDYVVHPFVDSEGKLSSSWAKLQLSTSVDYNVESTFLNWTLGGFNAHTLHHLLPDVSHVHYLKLLPILREVSRKHGLLYMEMSYLSALKSHFRFLKMMGNNKNFKPRNYEG